jgi:hypothetical protein
VLSPFGGLSETLDGNDVANESLITVLLREGCVQNCSGF